MRGEESSVQRTGKKKPDRKLRHGKVGKVQEERGRRKEGKGFSEAAEREEEGRSTHTKP